jgi:Flp pilus assembly protein TadB
VGRNRRQRDFYCSTAFLEDDKLIHLANEMKRSGAKQSGCLLLQAPLWLLVILALVACWLVSTIVSKTEVPPTIAPMFIFGGFLLSTVYTAARKWVFRLYYRQPVIIGT